LRAASPRPGGKPLFGQVAQDLWCGLAALPSHSKGKWKNRNIGKRMLRYNSFIRPNALGSTATNTNHSV
jgi:hypothetical protein